LIDDRQGRSGRPDGGDHGSFTLFTDVDQPLRVVEEARSQGHAVQVNNVLLSHCQCCCGPHPAGLWPNPFSANPFSANPFSANPFSANPFSANPFSANPFSANPHGSVSAYPFSANPTSTRDIQASLLNTLVHARDRPETAELRATGLRPHSAHPATAPDLPVFTSESANRREPSIVVIDTGIARGGLCPNALAGVDGYETPGFPFVEVPDEDQDMRIDPVAGHGTFIAGIIERICPGCILSVHGLLAPDGAAKETDIATTLEKLLERDGGPPKLVNLSFGGYSVMDMARLREAVRKLQDQGTVVVASAGNDATCWPAYPAAFPDVVSVGALGPHGPAPFTNYGPWVRACAPGVDMVSTFFTTWESKLDDRAYAEWVRWSGTSFAAPAVVGALARAMRDGLSGQQAVERLIDDPGLFRIPGLGVVVNQRPLFLRTDVGQ
jgi:hypothetical protein